MIDHERELNMHVEGQLIFNGTNQSNRMKRSRMNTVRTVVTLSICLFAMSHVSFASAEKGPYMAAFGKDRNSPWKNIRNGVIVADEQYTSQANDPAGHYTNTLRYSTDYGHTWEYPEYPTSNETYNFCSHDSATRSDVFAVKYLGSDGDKVFMMLSTAGIICYSTTGSDWIMASPARGSTKGHDEDRSVYDVTYANGTFVAVGGAGIEVGALVKYTKGPPDDENGWQSITVGNLDLYSVTFGKGKFVAVGEHSTAWYSSDGVTWTQSTNLSGEANFNKVIFVQEAKGGAGQFIAIASESTVWYSADGMSWTQAAVLDGGTADFRDVTYGNGKYIAVGNNNAVSVSTNDGLTWNTDTLALIRNDLPFGGFIDIHPHAVIYDDATGRFIVVTADEDALFFATGSIFYSSDGYTWTYANIYPDATKKDTQWESYLAAIINTDKGMFAIPYGSGVALAQSPPDILWSPPSPRASSGIDWVSLCGFNGGDCPQGGRAGRIRGPRP